MLLTRYGADVALAHPEGYELMDDTLESAARRTPDVGGPFPHDGFDGGGIQRGRRRVPEELGPATT